MELNPIHHKHNIDLNMLLRLKNLCIHFYCSLLMTMMKTNIFLFGQTPHHGYICKIVNGMLCQEFNRKIVRIFCFVVMKQFARNEFF